MQRPYHHCFASLLRASRAIFQKSWRPNHRFYSSIRTPRKRIPVDMVVHCRYVVPMSPVQWSDQRVLQHTSLLVHQGRIVDILPREQAENKYDAQDVVHKDKDHVVLPGFINAHTHVGMTLLRGLADDYQLSEWLTRHIWPTEAKWVSPEFVKDSTYLGVAEMIRSGTTCFNESYFYPSEIASVCEKVGMRAMIGMTVIDVPTSYAATTEEYILKGMDVYYEYNRNSTNNNGIPTNQIESNNSLIGITVNPHAPYTVSDADLVRLNEMSEVLGLQYHIHLHETAMEVEHSRQGNRESQFCHRSDEKCSPLTNMHRLGIVGERLIAVHMTQINAQDIQLLARQRAHVVHCPKSNMKLGSGFCPANELMAANVNVALGTDSVAANNTLDMISEMQTAALLAKGRSCNSSVLPAYQALQMATINGAKALGIENVTGSLSVGKSADFIAIDTAAIEMAPLFDVLSHLVYAASRHNVSDVWIRGQRLLNNRQLCTLDMDRTYAHARQWATRIKEHYSKTVTV